jgi:predicted dehydrogenase
MSVPLQIGILGCASVATYALIEPARHASQVVISGIASRSIERARSFAEQHRISRGLSEL